MLGLGKKAKEIRVDTRVGKDKYRVKIGSSGANSHVFKNGKEVENLRFVQITIPEEGEPFFVLCFRTKGDK